MIKPWVVTLMIPVIAALAGSLSAHGAGFDCGKAKTPTEKAICNSPPLSQADDRLASQYAALLKTLPKEEVDAFKQEQMGWIKERNGCGADTACLSRLYSARNQALSARLDKRLQSSEPRRPIDQAEIARMAEYYWRGKHDLWDVPVQVLAVEGAAERVRVDLLAQGRGYSLELTETGQVLKETAFTP